MSNDSVERSSRRTVLKTIGTTVGATGLLSGSAASLRDGTSAVGGRFGPLAIDEKNRPLSEARCWMVNGTERAIDVYVNYAASPPITDVKPKSIGSVFKVAGTADRPYGTYTFEARDRGQPDDEVLASASVTMAEGDSFSAALHRVGEFDYRMSIYRNDYTPSEEARVVVRHCAYPETIDWELTDNEETPRIPDDPRSGTLQRGEWQVARDVTEQDYLFEALVDDQVAAFEVDYEFEIETAYAVYIVGDPAPQDLPDDPPYEESRDGGIDESQWLLAQGFEVGPGDSVADTTSAPAQPTSVSDTNQHIVFECDPIVLHETNATEVEIGATDPDGIVSGLGIVDVGPPTDSITIVDNSTDRALLQGAPTTATLRIGPDVAPANYDLTVAANPHSLGATETHVLSVDVRPIPVSRLYDLVDRYQLSEDVNQSIATDLNVTLDDAAAHLRNDETTEACAALKSVTDILGNHKGKGVSEPAHNDLQTETKAVRTDLGCG